MPAPAAPRLTARTPLIAGTVAAALLLAGGAWWLGRAAGDRFAECRTGVVSGGLEAFGVPFTLTDETGARVTDANVFDRPSLLYFGYTFCPDVCPLDSARTAEAVDLLAAKGETVRSVFITVDPRRDTPEALTEFTDALSPTMLGLTGTKEEIAAVSKGWRNYFRINDAEESEYYLVDHMTNTYLVMPGAGTVDFFTRDTSPEALADRVQCFLDAAR